MSRYIWEGWTVDDFINDLSAPLEWIQNGESWHAPIKDANELKEWLKDNQPYYKHHIPEVFKHFKDKYDL